MLKKRFPQADSPEFMEKPAPKARLDPNPFGNKRAPPRREHEALGGYAYRVLREAIRSGTFRPGEHLRETDVAHWLGISRTPVREAFHRITTEGLVTNGPWNGVMIADLDEDQLKQLYAVREALEGTAAALAAQHATAPDIKQMVQILEMEACALDDAKQLVILNGKFHQTLYRASHNRYLLVSVNSVVDALGLLRRSTFVVPGSIELAHEEHQKILEAIRLGRPADAEQAARLHVRNALLTRRKLRSTVGIGVIGSSPPSQV
jgi:DNA-binding GntR family transcriptional regulator